MPAPVPASVLFEGILIQYSVFSGTNLSGLFRTAVFQPIGVVV